ncbi:nuclear distribution protein nudE-like 1 isoform X2 [Bacillus rossius redtenbacheri]|uniref:nuclear distribution protein nudE-like 1 isoform X2 n=1 Tax=Bacillus rossius redtenbacheri TaxID=93214 RepID=UPI002FDD6BA8
MDAGMPAPGSRDEEALYWKELAEQCGQDLEDVLEEKRQVERDLEEFQENSRQLERELEISLDQSEKRCRDLEAANNRLQADCEGMREKLERANGQNCDLQALLAEARAREELHQRRVRELEQRNDDLERANRAVVTSLEEHELKLNSAIERNAILEVEQDETKALLQRIKDESRDLMLEMKVRGSVPDNDKSMERLHGVDSNKLTAQTQTAVPAAPLKIVQPGGMQSSPISPSARVASMNIVGDLLRKVGVQCFCPCFRPARHGQQSADYAK